MRKTFIPAMGSVADALSMFEARQSTDDVKRDLELTCRDCGGVICDVEHGDTLDVLMRTAADHECSAQVSQTAARVLNGPHADDPRLHAADLTWEPHTQADADADGAMAEHLAAEEERERAGS